MVLVLIQTDGVVLYSSKVPSNYMNSETQPGNEFYTNVCCAYFDMLRIKDSYVHALLSFSKIYTPYLEF